MKTKANSRKSNFRLIPGIHIQWPWSRQIASGEKTVETRGYALIGKYVGVEMAIIETAGPKGKREAGISTARIIGTVTFDECFRYDSRAQWEKDFGKHRVSKADNNFGYGNRPETWAWVVSKTVFFPNSFPPPRKRGIVFALECAIPTNQKYSGKFD